MGGDGEGGCCVGRCGAQGSAELQLGEEKSRRGDPQELGAALKHVGAGGEELRGESWGGAYIAGHDVPPTLPRFGDLGRQTARDGGCSELEI